MVSSEPHSLVTEAELEGSIIVELEVEEEVDLEAIGDGKGVVRQYSEKAI